MTKKLKKDTTPKTSGDIPTPSLPSKTTMKTTSNLENPSSAQNPKVVYPLKDLVANLVEVRDRIAQEDEGYAKAKALLDAEYAKRTNDLIAARDHLGKEVIAKMKEDGQFSSRFQDQTVTLSVRKTGQIEDEQLFINHLELMELDKGLVITEKRVDKTAVKGMLKKIAETGKLAPGTAIKETEFISINKATKDERRKVQTEEFRRIEKGQ